MKWGYGHADYQQERLLEQRERKFERNKVCLLWKENGWASKWKCNNKNQNENMNEEENETSLSHFVATSSQSTWISKKNHRNNCIISSC